VYRALLLLQGPMVLMLLQRGIWVQTMVMQQWMWMQMRTPLLHRQQPPQQQQVQEEQQQVLVLTWMA
jgi:hypothetical protein